MELVYTERKDPNMETWRMGGCEEERAGDREGVSSLIGRKQDSMVFRKQSERTISRRENNSLGAMLLTVKKNGGEH